VRWGKIYGFREFWPLLAGPMFFAYKILYKFERTNKNYTIVKKLWLSKVVHFI